MHAPSAASEDVAALYCALSRRLERIVRRAVGAPDPVTEDACQIAWASLMRHRDSVRAEAVFSWLARTAVREAVRLRRRDERYASLDGALERAGDSLVLGRVPSPDELIAQRERLARIRELPVRQQRLLWLHAAGLSYAEIAAHEGCTIRAVERHLLGGRRRIRSACAE